MVRPVRLRLAPKQISTAWSGHLVWIHFYSWPECLSTRPTGTSRPWGPRLRGEPYFGPGFARIHCMAWRFDRYSVYPNQHWCDFCVYGWYRVDPGLESTRTAALGVEVQAILLPYH